LYSSSWLLPSLLFFSSHTPSPPWPQTELVEARVARSISDSAADSGDGSIPLRSASHLGLRSVSEPSGGGISPPQIQLLLRGRLHSTEEMSVLRVKRHRHLNTDSNEAKQMYQIYGGSIRIMSEVAVVGFKAGVAERSLPGTGDVRNDDEGFVEVAIGIEALAVVVDWGHESCRREDISSSATTSADFSSAESPRQLPLTGSAHTTAGYDTKYCLGSSWWCMRTSMDQPIKTNKRRTPTMQASRQA
ncbi:hypothetical protein AKJ16_DCAP11590, partial [Drosera capensis]